MARHIHVNINQNTDNGSTDGRVRATNINPIRYVILGFLAYLAFAYITLPSYVKYTDRLAGDYWLVQSLFQPSRSYNDPRLPVQHAVVRPTTQVEAGNCYYNKTRCPKIGSRAQRVAAVDYAEYLGAQYGLPRGFMATMGWLESKHNPNAKYCSYKRGKKICYKRAAAGWYQYILETARGHGVGDKGRYNAVWSATQAAKDAKKRMRVLSKLSGKEVSNRNGTTVWLYLAHNQGDCGIGLIVQMAEKGRVNKWCVSKKTMFTNIYKNSHRNWKRIVRNEKVFNQVSARAYLNSMRETWRMKEEQVKEYM